MNTQATKLSWKSVHQGPQAMNAQIVRKGEGLELAFGRRDLLSRQQSGAERWSLFRYFETREFKSL